MAGERKGKAYEALLKVVLEDLLDQFDDRELGQVVQLARVRNRVTRFSNCEGALHNREVGLGHGVRFQQNTTDRGHIGNHIPGEGIALLLALLGDIVHVGELAKLHQWLHVHAKDIT